MDAVLSTVLELPPLREQHCAAEMQRLQDCALLQPNVPEGALEGRPQVLLQAEVICACVPKFKDGAGLSRVPKGSVSRREL